MDVNSEEMYDGEGNSEEYNSSPSALPLEEEFPSSAPPLEEELYSSSSSPLPLPRPTTVGKLNLDEIDLILLELSPKDLNRACRSSRIFNNACKRDTFKTMYNRRWYIDIREFFLNDVYKPFEGLAYAIAQPYSRERDSLFDFFLNYIKSTKEISCAGGNELLAKAIQVAIDVGDIASINILLPYVTYRYSVDNYLYYSTGKKNDPTINTLILSPETLTSDSYLYKEISERYVEGLARGAHSEECIRFLQNSPGLIRSINMLQNLYKKTMKGFDRDRPLASIDIFNYLRSITPVIQQSSTIGAYTSGRIEAVNFLISGGWEDSSHPNDILIKLPLICDPAIVDLLIKKGGNPIYRTMGLLKQGDKDALLPYMDYVNFLTTERINTRTKTKTNPHHYPPPSPGRERINFTNDLITIFGGLFKRNNLTLALELLNLLTPEQLGGNKSLGRKSRFSLGEVGEFNNMLTNNKQLTFIRVWVDKLDSSKIYSSLKLPNNDTIYATKLIILLSRLPFEGNKQLTYPYFNQDTVYEFVYKKDPCIKIPASDLKPLMTALDPVILSEKDIRSLLKRLIENYDLLTIKLLTSAIIP